MPVEGPARWMLKSTAGISAKYARPMNSVISEMPGPDVAVNERAPFQEAPITMPIEASSSSACTIANFAWPVSLSMRKRLQWLVKASATDEEGVIGYQAQTVAPPYTAPSAAAELPSMKMRSPTASDLLHRQSDRAAQMLERIVAAEMQRMHVRRDQLVLALELFAEQFDDRRHVHVEQRRKRADVDDVLE